MIMNKQGKQRSITSKVMLVDSNITKVIQEVKPYNVVTDDFFTDARVIVSERYCTKELREKHHPHEIRAIVDVIEDEEIVALH